MRLPESIERSLEEVLGGKVLGARAVGGGMVGRTARVETDGGPIFVKWKEGAPARWFGMEEDGLSRLRESCPLRIPKVLAWRDAPDSDPPFLALEWLEASAPPDRRDFDRRLGEGLAELHRNTSSNGMFGLDLENFLGSQPQSNSWTDSWPSFYRDHRLVPQIERARRLGELPPLIEHELMDLLDRLETILGERKPAPRLIHGDLWAGNLLSLGSTPALIDPAVYYADREMEIAYMQLFAGFSGTVFEAYEAVLPLDDEFEFRRPLHQLYPLLIHLNHFGREYLGQVQAVCRYYKTC